MHPQASPTSGSKVNNILFDCAAGGVEPSLWVELEGFREGAEDGMVVD